MGQTCSVCEHTSRDEIEAALASRTPLRELERRYPETTRSSLSRHGRAHLPASLVAMREQRTDDEKRTTLDRLEELLDRTCDHLDSAEEAGRLPQVLSCIAEARKTLELIARVSGELRDGPQLVVNLLASPEWVRVRALLLEALADHPEARVAVAGRLVALEARSSGE